MALKSVMSPEEQVAAAVAPVLAYQPDDYERAEEAYYLNEEARLRDLGKGKEAEIAPFPARPQVIPLPGVTPSVTVDAPPPVLTSPPAEPIVGISREGRALTPCDLGMCEGRISMGNLGSGYNNSSLYTNGVTTLVTGPGLGGRSRFSQLMGAGALARRGATPQQVEAQNRGLDIERFTNAQRSPEWTAAYQDAFNQTRSPQAAAAAANAHVASTDAGIAGLYYRQQLPLDSAAVGDAIRQQNTQAMVTGDYSRAGYLSANPVAAVPVVQGYQVDDNGTVTVQGNLAGRDFTTQGADAAALQYGLNVTTPQQLYQLQQQQQQIAQAQAAAQADAVQRDFTNNLSIFNATRQAFPAERPMTEYQQEQIRLAEERNALRAQEEQARATRTGSTTNTAQAAAPQNVTVNGVTIAAPSAPGATSTAPVAPATPRIAIPPVSDPRLPTSTRRTAQQANDLVNQTQRQINEIVTSSAPITSAGQRRLQALVNNLAWFKEEARLASAPKKANTPARPATATLNRDATPSQADFQRMFGNQ